MYSFKSRVRYSESDSECRMTFPALLNYFQDCCTFQSEDLEIGIDFLAKKHTAWMLIAWQVVVKQRPMFGEEITVTTWPYDFKGFYGYRNFKMERKDGTLLAYANSVWAYMDMQTMRPCRLDQELLEAYRMEPRLEMEYADRKIALPAESEGRDAFAVHPSQIDTNGHVNNERYIEMAQQYLRKDFEIEEMRADYRKSAVLGDTICPSVAEDGNKVTVTLADEQKKPYAVVEFYGR